MQLFLCGPLPTIRQTSYPGGFTGELTISTTSNLVVPGFQQKSCAYKAWIEPWEKWRSRACYPEHATYGWSTGARETSRSTITPSLRTLSNDSWRSPIRAGRRRRRIRPKGGRSKGFAFRCSGRPRTRAYPDPGLQSIRTGGRKCHSVGRHAVGMGWIAGAGPVVPVAMVMYAGLVLSLTARREPSVPDSASNVMDTARVEHPSTNGEIRMAVCLWHAVQSVCQRLCLAPAYSCLAGARNSAGQNFTSCFSGVVGMKRGNILTCQHSLRLMGMAGQ